MKKREEYFLNTIRHYGDVSGDHFFGPKDETFSYTEAYNSARYLVTYRWHITHDENNNIIHSRRELIALKRKRGKTSFTQLLPKRILDLLKMAAFPEIIE